MYEYPSPVYNQKLGHSKMMSLLNIIAHKQDAEQYLVLTVVSLLILCKSLGYNFFSTFKHLWHVFLEADTW